MLDSTDIELLQPGETILDSQYTIEKHLGSGGQGQVYLARHPIFVQVAVKRLHRHIAAQEAGRARFERELQITYQLRGEHVVLIHDFEKDTARDEWFSVMEYANSGSLKDKLATEAPLTITEAIDLAIAFCQALTHVHEYPYVHGDLKPNNILFHTTPTGKRILKLSDFGSAFQPVQAGALPLPSGLKAAHTKLYVSPELLDASDPEDMEALTVGVDQRADIYAIGVILYEMLTGRPPFWEPFSESEDVMVRLEREHALLRKVGEQLPPEPKRQRGEILLSLNDLVMKALAKDPADRFVSVSEMQAHLERVWREEKVRLAKLDRLRPLADQALGKNQWGKASDLLYQVLEQAPDDPDALQKLKIAQGQQELGNLRHQIPRKMNEGLWQEAKGLVEEALEIAPDDETLTTWQEKIDNQLTIIGILKEAKEAVQEADWPEVIRLCLKALELDHRHTEASSLLSQAQTQDKIATLHQEAETLRQQKDKQGELAKLKELHVLAPADEEVNARVETLQKTIDLETYYAQGKQAYEEKRWEAAIEALAYVVDIDKFYYLDAAPMLLEARDQFDKELSAKLDDQHRQGLQELFDESEELIASKQWQKAWETLRAIHRDRNYQDVIAKEKLLTRMFYVLGCQHAEAEEWYQAKQRFAKVLKYTPSYRDAEQQLNTARSNNRLRRNYVIKWSLGSGITSQVDCAVDLKRGQRKVSLKYLTATGGIEHRTAINRRFRRQAQSCMVLDHSNIVKIYAVEMLGLEGKGGSEQADMPVVVMEYIDGQNLAGFLEKTRRVPEMQAVALTLQLCNALQYAHGQGFLHLDIKPSNILIQKADGQLKLTDFDHTSRGTRGYRSPEQVAHSAKLDKRTDIFAAGKVLYALLTGKLPVEDQLEEDPSFEKITSPLQAVIRKATAPNPEDRYQSAQEMSEALKKAKAALPLWLKFRHQVGVAWQKIVEVNNTLKIILSIVGVLLAFVGWILAAEDATPAGRIREKVVIYIQRYIPATITYRSIGEIKFIVNGTTVKDIIQPHYIADTRQINIEVRVQDADGETISGDEILCQWTFAPPLLEQAIRKEDGCQISYQVPENLDRQLVQLEMRGKDVTKIAGMSINFINIILQSAGVSSNE